VEETRDKEALLQDELKKSQDLASLVHQLEMNLQEAAEKHRDQVHFEVLVQPRNTQ
jgi:hypothetical protein